MGAGYYLAGQLGLLTVLPDRPLALVAPSAGVAVLWFSWSTRRTLPYDVAVVAVASAALSVQLGLGAALVAFGVVATLAQVAVFVGSMRRWCPDLVPFGTARQGWRLGDLGLFLVASGAAGGAAAVLSTVAQAIGGLPTGDVPTLLVRWGRSSSAIVAIASLGLLLAPSLRSIGTVGRLGGWLVARVRASPPRTLEAAGLLAATLALYASCFWLFEDLPLTFLLFVVTAWAGIRFAPAAVAAQGLLAGTIGVLFTLAGHGVFAALIEDPAERAPWRSCSSWSPPRPGWR